MTVTVTNPGPTYYDWFKNAAPLTNATNALTWPRVGVSAGREYRVRVSGLGGTVDSAPATLSVIAPPFDLWRIAAFGERTGSGTGAPACH